MRVRVLNERGETHFAGGPIRYRRDVRGAAGQLAPPRRRALHSRRIPDSGMASDRRAGRPAGGLGRGRLHAGRAGAGDADRPDRRAQNPDRGIGGQCARHVAVRPVCHRPVVGRVLQRHRRHRLCGRLHARPQGADRPARARRFIARGHALHVELFVRRRAVVPGLATRRGSLGLACRIPGDRARSAGDAGGLLPAAAGRAKARAGTLAGFRAGVPQHQRDGLRARLWRALLRALRHPNLAGRVLDLRGDEEFGRLAADARRRQRGVLRAGDARQHSRQ